MAGMNDFDFLAGSRNVSAGRLTSPFHRWRLVAEFSGHAAVRPIFGGPETGS
jgi:hypothetical protein